MPITLVFHGGLFTILPGVAPARRVDVHMRLPEEIRVTAKKGERLSTMEALWSAASRIDFVSRAVLKPDFLPIRPISHLIPIDYQGFHKTVSFTGGTVTGVGDPVPRKTAIRMSAVKSRNNLDEMLREFKQFAGVTQNTHDHDHDHDQEYLKEMVQEFFERLSPKELRAWLPGYRVQVKLPSRGTEVVLNGRRPERAGALPDGLRVEFPIDPKSTIPHYPLNNPHVLEQPPTT